MFQLFGLPHIGVLLATVAAAALYAALGRRPSIDPQQRWTAWPLAFALILNELIWNVYRGYVGTWSLSTSLPLHLCDAAIVMSVVALLTQKRVPFELAYFWGLGGSVQALLTPGLEECGFPTYEFFRYFFSHSGILVAVAYLAWGRGMRPTARSLFRAIAITAAYMACVGAVDYWLDANYMFLCHTPSTASLLDWLGPWPWYLVPLVCIGAGLMTALYLPYYVVDRYRKRTAAPR